jgi:hypothetical protein
MNAKLTGRNSVFKTSDPKLVQSRNETQQSGMNLGTCHAFSTFQVTVSSPFSAANVEFYAFIFCLKTNCWNNELNASQGKANLQQCELAIRTAEEILSVILVAAGESWNRAV